MPPGQAQALGLEGPGKCWRVQSHMEARPKRKFVRSYGHLRLFGGEPRGGEWDCVLMLG